MADNGQKSPTGRKHDGFQPGFLRVEQAPGGTVGGLLVTNRLGRPLEFQCTTPVRPNRTQEILYGPTLESFVFSELIGKTLHDRLNCPPDVIFVNQLALMELRSLLDLPVLGLGAIAKGSKNVLGGRSILLHTDFPGDSELVRVWERTLPPAVDLEEPLQRIHEALNETLRSVA